MSDNELRLRLVIRRHGLPEVKLVWTAPADPDFTISKLVAQVNEVVPLESGEWGLEDYAVELRAADGSTFECLHFQSVPKVLNNDDQVIIRSLLTDDLKRRRLSGRHQISFDGKHLVDGVAFGRPWLRLPRDRPPVSLPPRKRARILDDAGDDADRDEHDANEEDSPLLLEFPGLATSSGRVHSTRRSSKRVRIAVDSDDTDVNRDDYERHNHWERGRENVEDDGAEESEEAEEAEDDEFRPDNEDDSDGDADLDIDQEDLLDELHDIREENVALGDEAADEAYSMDHHLETSEIVHASSPPARPLMDLDTLDKIAILRAAFPTAPVSLCEEAVTKHGKDIQRAYRQLSAAHRPSMDFGDMLDHQLSVTFSSSARQVVDPLPAKETPNRLSSTRRKPASATQPANVKFPPQHDNKEASDDADSLSSSSSETSSSSDTGSISGLQTREAIKQRLRNANHAESMISQPNSGSGPDDDVDGDSTFNPTQENENASDALSRSSTSSPAPSLSSSSLSDSTDDDTVVRHPRQKEHESSTAPDLSELSSDASTSSEEESEESDEESSDDSQESEDDSDMSSDSEPEEMTSKSIRKQFQSQAITKSTPAVTAVAENTTASNRPTAPPGSGLRKTQRRNLRRRLAKRFASGTGETNTVSQKLTDGRGQGIPGVASSGAPPESQQARQQKEAELLARKQALLAMMEDDEPTNSAQNQQDQQQASHSVLVEKAPQDPETVAESQGDGTSSARRNRVKVDTSAGRRMLFGALGLRNPKSKAEEDKLRKDLMKNVRPHVNLRNPSSTLSAQVGTTEPSASVEKDSIREDEGPREESEEEEGEGEEEQAEDPEAWREKINYRAVECCDEGIELSEPPFPFVQRWDPQQHGSHYHYGSNKNGRGGKRKRAQRNSGQFYQEAKNGGSVAAKKQRTASDFDEPAAVEEQHDETEYDDTAIRYDDEEDEGGAEEEEEEEEEERPVQSTMAAESQMSDIDDLPSLPSDLSTLSPLPLGDAKPGMVITWKEWLLSSATNWQPQLANIVAVVVKVEAEDGTRFRLLLAKRDRGMDRIEKVYDEETGERVYDRFEAPDTEDEDEEDGDAVDDGYRNKEYSELMEPMIVQQPLKDYGAPGDRHRQEQNSRTESVVPDTYQDQDCAGERGSNANGSPATSERASEEDATGATAGAQRDDDPFRSSSPVPVDNTRASTSTPSRSRIRSSPFKEPEGMSVMVNSSEQAPSPGSGSSPDLDGRDPDDEGYIGGEDEDMEVDEDTKQEQQQQEQHREEYLDDAAGTSESPPKASIWEILHPCRSRKQENMPGRGR
ncbi:hypothetical protein SODALDRAFT_377319 [Sodiomyces alkalinus F11]|uniref:DUF7357 domain-containing protein n=1 Tax=Sodiomyces alkalinus (strain CBS 110278 / VKM F-3762 / F11) TaxID=1314773 RepID=A0A3N2Q4P1_SODAK|nr:hypothetical protein SODALDRAFT_377319 [Sodiomyces alkalinus F11]ROT41667.1 hypothetical protein SODALDRAFT_377319 [Sodiomyces alkalinus F11]